MVFQLLFFILLVIPHCKQCLRGGSSHNVDNAIIIFHSLSYTPVQAVLAGKNQPERRQQQHHQMLLLSASAPGLEEACDRGSSQIPELVRDSVGACR